MTLINNKTSPIFIKFLLVSNSLYRLSDIIYVVNIKTKYEIIFNTSMPFPLLNKVTK